MPERLKQIWEKIKAWWNKFTKKQKTIIIAVTAGVVVVFAVMIYIFTRPQYITWESYASTKETSEVLAILDDAGVEYETTTDGLTIKVKAEQVGTANLALGAAGYVPNSYTISDAISGGFATTSSDKQKQWVYYLEKKLATDISTISSVKKCTVSLNIPDNTGTLISTAEESSAWIQLTLNDKFTSDQAATVALAVATALGNSSTANITIVDSDANLLFSGEEVYSKAGIAGNMMELRSQAETYVASDVKKIMVGSKQFDMVEVACRLDINYAEYQKTVHLYYANEGREEGMISHIETIDEENTSGAGGPPGTDSNDETTYYWQNGENSESSSSSKLIDYLPNESISVENLPAGVVNYGTSSLTVTAISYKTIKQQDAKNQGLLDGITWEEFKSANDTYTKLVVDPDFYSAVSDATGIPEDSITIIAYETPQFIDKEKANINITDILSMLLIALILGLLAFVVIRSMATKKEVPEEEELSVETLLQSTPETSVEDIELETKSETRKMIEKFVDENPEAAANLLRNWLNEEWG